MTDDRLREAERAFQETGDVSAETRLLRERLRAGTLAAERLELAAALHHEAALLALGRPRTSRDHAVSRVMESLEHFGREVVVRAALIVARRCSESSPHLADTKICLGAVEAWVACPCDRHLRDLERLRPDTAHVDAWLAAQLALGRARPGDLHGPPRFGQRTFESHLADPPLVATVRRTLAAWALGLPERRAPRTATPGTLLELRIGARGEARTHRLLVAREKLLLGGKAIMGVVIDDAGGDHCEIARAGAGYEVRAIGDPSFLSLDDEELTRAPLATGDVITLRHAWVEVTVHAAPFDPEIERAREDAARLGAGLPEEERRRRTHAAALCGHLAATLALYDGGWGLRITSALGTWMRMIGELPSRIAVAASLVLAREAEPLWTRTFPGESVVGRALEAAEAWLAESSAENLSRARERKGELALAIGRAEGRARGPATGRTGELDGALAAGRVARECLDAIENPGALALALGIVTDAGVSRDRARDLVSEEVLRWATGSAP